MKLGLQIFLSICFSFYLINALPTSNSLQSNKLLKQKLNALHNSFIRKNETLGISFCKVCVEFSSQALDQLLNAILNIGVVGSCSTLCSYVQQQIPSQIVEVVCNLLCDYVGIEEFIKIIEEADLDPIYYCELLKACAINDNGDANITSFIITPKQGPQGTTFTAEIDYTSLNGTGTGELYIEIITVDRIPLEDSFLMEASSPGKYKQTISINASPDPDCDPTEGPCEQWLPGDYITKIALCNGECGSKHPHSQVYSQASATFTITN